ncbi:hypothetical protein BBP40_012594 [Aspergillus hancockii]|nr:hypothetical protein BBP40_012594 [Aspergillus hancockii]
MTKEEFTVIIKKRVIQRIMPNGARVLDQLQLYDEIKSRIEPLETTTVVYPDGFSFRSSYPKTISERFGFPISFLDRQKLLEILYQNYPYYDAIRLSEKVTVVEASEAGASVTTTSGKTYRGHLVVGADGVHSRVRSEIWRAAERVDPDLVTAHEQTSLKAEYRCIFGTSSPIKGLKAGEQVNAFFDGLSILTIHGKDGRVYWFVIQKLDIEYIYPNCPRFTSEDTALAAGSLKEIRFYHAITVGFYGMCFYDDIGGKYFQNLALWAHGSPR